MGIFCVVGNSLVNFEKIDWLADRKVMFLVVLFLNSVTVVNVYKLLDSSAKY
jgi:hypothetical protein